MEDYSEFFDSLAVPEDTEEEQVEQQEENCEEEFAEIVGDSIVSDEEEEKPVKHRTRRKKNAAHKDAYKKKTCKVMGYNAKKKTLDIKFDGYGIRLKDIDEDVDSDEVVVQYKGEIGKSDFQCKLG